MRETPGHSAPGGAEGDGLLERVISRRMLAFFVIGDVLGAGI
ncbi:MAG: hypothetical protein WEB05_02975 [Solirubrobacterales bacterium]